MTRRVLGLVLPLAVFWLLLSGHYTVLLLGFGVLSVLLVVVTVRRMDVVDGTRFRVRLPLRAPLYAGWLAAAEIADQGQVALRMQADHPEGAGPRALGTRIAELLIQDDSGGDVVASQGPAGTGRHARSPAPEAAYLGTVQAQRLVLHDAQSGGVDAEATLVPGDTSHLAGAAAGTKLISDDQSSHD